MIALRKLFVIVASVITCLAIALPCFAIADPDIGPVINAVYAFQNVSEDGDMLFIIDETISYNTLPVENAYSAFYLDFIDEDTITVIAEARIVPFYNSGYSRGLIAIYFDDATCTANTMVWNDVFVLSLEGDPTLTWDDGTAPADTITGADFTWSINTNMSAVKGEISSLVISLAQMLDATWGYSGTANSLLESTTDGLKLSGDGQAYFSGVLPGITGLGLDAFITSVYSPEVHKRVYTNTGATNLIGQLAGTPFDLTGVATSLGLTLGWLNAIVVIIIIVAIDYFMVRAQLSSKGIVMVDCFVFIIAAAMGVMPLLVVLGGAVLCILAMVNVFFWSKSGA